MTTNTVAQTKQMINQVLFETACIRYPDIR